jgi:hypothetical protein
MVKLMGCFPLRRDRRREFLVLTRRRQNHPLVHLKWQTFLQNLRPQR